jgi:hypothetical protein
MEVGSVMGVGPLAAVDGGPTSTSFELPGAMAIGAGNEPAVLTTTAPDVLVPPRRGRADRFARWALRVREPASGQEVHNIFSASMALSGTRCLLSYIVLPLLTPWLGALPFIGPAIGIPVGVLALVFDVRAMRRFFQTDHRWRWVAAAVYLAVMVMVATLVFRDVSRLI